MLTVSNEEYSSQSQLGHAENPADIGKHILHPASFLTLCALLSFLQTSQPSL